MYLPSVLFSLHPFADVWSAVFKLHAIDFAPHEIEHYLTVDDAHVFQVENGVAQVRLAFEKPPQLSDRWRFDPAAQGVNCEASSRRSLNPKRHRLAQHRSVKVQLRNPSDFIENRDLEERSE